MTKEVQLRLLLGVVVTASLFAAVYDAGPASAAANVRLACSSTSPDICSKAVDCAPEGHDPGAFNVIRLENHGDTPQDLTGWVLKSDPEATQVMSLDVAGTLVPLVDPNEDRVIIVAGPHGGNYPDRKTYLWSIGAVLRTSGDPPDYVRLYDASGNLVDSMDCLGNPVPLPAAEPTVTPAPQVANTNDQTGGGQPANESTATGASQTTAGGSAQAATTGQTAAQAATGGTAAGSVTAPNSGIGSLTPVKTSPFGLTATIVMLAAGLAGAAASGALFLRKGTRLLAPVSSRRRDESSSLDKGG